ncbi:MAG: site-specific integrase [Phycisphaerales bacterium]
MTPRPAITPDPTTERPDLPPALRRERDSFFVYLRVECGLMPASIEAYTRDVRDLLKDLTKQGVSSLASVEPAHLIRHVRALSRDRELAPATVARHIATMKVLFRWLVATGRADKNPADHLDQPARWKRLPGVISPGRCALIEAPAPPEHPRPGAIPLWLRDRAILELMYASGLRPRGGAIQLADINREVEAVRVLGKGDKQRMVPMGTPAVRGSTSTSSPAARCWSPPSAPPNAATRVVFS